jgi:methionyl-tRNA synthetase
VDAVAEEIEACKQQSAVNTLISISRVGNQYLNEKEPWKLIKKDKAKAANILNVAAQFVKALAIVSAPFIPFSAEEIWETLKLPGKVHEQEWSETLKPLPSNHKIAKAKPLFSKIDADEKELADKLEKVRKVLEKAA